MVMIGFGIFLLFNKCTFHSQVINRIAQSAFAVYLITVYDASITLLWKRLFNLGNLYQRPFAILQILGILLAIYMVCTLLDFVSTSIVHYHHRPSTRTLVRTAMGHGIQTNLQSFPHTDSRFVQHSSPELLKR